MYKTMRITVIGAGNGGLAIAGYASMKGLNICLFNHRFERLCDIMKTKKVQLQGAISGSGSIEVVTQDIEEAVRYSKLIFIVTTANAHREIAEQMAPYLKDDHTIVLSPGRTFGALEFGNVLKETCPSLKCHIAEAQTLIFACRIKSPGVVNIIGVKDKVLLAGRNSEETSYVHHLLSPIFPCFIKAKSLIETGFLNVGAIFHPSIVIFNAATIERNDNFFFYREMTPQIASCIESLDRERLDVASAYGLELMPVSEWISYAYPSTKGKTLCERLRNNPAYYDIKAPGSIFTRQLTEDIPTGLLPMSELGHVAGVETPLMDSFICLSSALLNVDFSISGRTLNRLGLAGLTVEQIIDVIS